MTTSTPGTAPFVDLSHQLYDGMAPYHGLPLPRIGALRGQVASRPNFDGEEFFLGKIDMPTNVGTYIDVGFHRFRDRRWASEAYWEPGPYLSVGFADVLVNAGFPVRAFAELQP